MKPRTRYLIAYDIADPRRLGKTCRYLKKIGYHLQYSVFLAELTRAEHRILIENLDRMIHPREDDVRIYPLPESPEWTWIGREPLPEASLFLQEKSLLPERTCATKLVLEPCKFGKQDKCHS